MESEDYGQSYYPDEASLKKNIDSLIEILTRSGSMIKELRREFRGEELMQMPNGDNVWIQTSKPLFVRTNLQTEEPLKVKVKLENGEEVEQYVPHDEAIEEILNAINMMGLNQTTPLGTTNDPEMNLDLYQFEIRLSKLLTLNRKKWGIEKSVRPMIYNKIRQRVQDARTMQLDGRVLKSLTQISRITETVQRGERKQRSPYE